jgi:hypothetical protein
MAKIEQQTAGHTADSAAASWMRDLAASLAHLEWLELGFLLVGIFMIVVTVTRDDFDPGRSNLVSFVGVVEKISTSVFSRTGEFHSTSYILRAKDGSTHEFTRERYLRFDTEPLTVGSTIKLKFDPKSNTTYVVETADGSVLLDYDTAHAAYNRGLKEWTALYVGIFFASMGLLGATVSCRQRFVAARRSRIESVRAPNM